MYNRFLILVFLLCPLLPLQAQDEEEKEQLKILKNARTDTALIQANLDLSIFYWETNPLNSIAHGQQALAIAKKINKQDAIARSQQIIGIAYDYKGELDSCMKYLNESLALYRKLNKIDKESHVTSDIATAWYFRGNYELALRLHLQALKLRQQFGNKNFMAISYNNLGLVYRSKKEYAKAIEFYKNSLQIKQVLNDEKGMLNAYMNIGSAFQSQGIFDSAFYYGNSALALAKKNNLENDIAASEGNIAAALVNLNRPDEALPIVEKVEKKALVMQEKKILITTYETLGDIYLQKNNPALASGYFEKGLTVALSNHRTEATELFYRKLAKTNYLLGNYKKGYEQLEAGKKLADSMLNAENSRHMNELSAVYESAEKESRIRQLNAENKIAITESNRKKQQNIYLIITSLLFFGLALISYKAFTSNKKQKELLDEKNKAIQKALEEKEYLMREIHHRVKNNLQMISSLLSLQSNYIKDETALEAVNDSRNRVHSMSLIHQSLYHEENLAAIDVKEYTLKLVDNLYQSYTINPDKIKLLAEIAPLQLDIDSIIPVGLILNELITNCLKYAFPGNASGMIKVKLQQESNLLKISVYDNGAGLPESFFTEQQKTFGHKMIQAFLKKLNGKMRIFNEDGTKVDISIQLTTA